MNNQNCYHPLAEIWETEEDEDWGELYGVRNKSKKIFYKVLKRTC